MDSTSDVGGWLRADGPEGDVVVSSRVRLARNIAGFPFLAKATPIQQSEILTTCRERILDALPHQAWTWIDLPRLSDRDREVLVERHLISRHHCKTDCARGVAIAADESAAIMVNEEDHLRLQVIRAGLRLDDVLREITRIDDQLEERLDYAYSARYGYLTACPTNVGTGIRVSVMLHLPALKMTGEIEKVYRAAKDMHLAVRGFHGEGSDAIGDLYQVSNQTTLGRAEEAILADFSEVIIPSLIRYERRARQAMIDHRANVLDDKIHRAIGLLSHARLLSSEETLYLLSHLRLGVVTQRVPELGLAFINELLLHTQPAHLQAIAKRPLEGLERREFRATYLRSRLHTALADPDDLPTRN